MQFSWTVKTDAFTWIILFHRDPSSVIGKVVQYAVKNEALLVTNDNYKNLTFENGAFKEQIDKRLVGYKWEGRTSPCPTSARLRLGFLTLTPSTGSLRRSLLSRNVKGKLQVHPPKDNYQNVDIFFRDGSTAGRFDSLREAEAGKHKRTRRRRTG